MSIPVDGYPRYEVFRDGRIYSHKSNKFLKHIKHKNGYMYVELFNEHGSKIMAVHRIVATAFIPNPQNLPCVNHKDECPPNNNVDNLEWCTHKYNTNYGSCLHRRVEHTDYSKPMYRKLALKNSMKRRRPVAQCDRDGNVLRTFESGAEAFRETGIRHISDCCNGRRNQKTAGGFGWKYL